MPERPQGLDPWTVHTPSRASTRYLQAPDSYLLVELGLVEGI